jgi:hypothetical protein
MTGRSAAKEKRGRTDFDGEKGMIVINVTVNLCTCFPFDSKKLWWIKKLIIDFNDSNPNFYVTFHGS